MRWTYIATLALLGACTHEAAVLEAPVEEIPTSYGSQIPGRWSVYIDGTAFNGSVSPQGYGCAGMKYPFNASQAFAKSVLKTLDGLIERVEAVPAPKAQPDSAGLIVIRTADFQGSIVPHTSWISAGSYDVKISASASLSVDGKAGRLLGSTIEAEGAASGSSGIACEGGSEVTAQAVSAAIKNASRKIGEAIGNSERIREASR